MEIDQYPKRRMLRKRRRNEMRNYTSLYEINPSNSLSFRSGCSSSATDYPLDYNWSPYSPQPKWRPSFYAGCYSTFFSRSSRFSPLKSIGQDNVTFKQEENKNTNGWEPTGRLLKNEEQFTLEKTKKETKDQMDVVEPKDLVPKLLEIRASLVEKIQCSDIYTTGSTAEQIMFDIKWLIKDKIGEKVPDNANSSKFVSVTEYEVHLITMIASYLRMVSFSVNLDFIYSYVEKIDNALSKQYIESLLKKYPTFFQEESNSAGTEKKWTYLELKPIITI